MSKSTEPAADCHRPAAARRPRRRRRLGSTRQLRLFDELVEIEVTRDHVNDVGVFIQPPPGPGWRVLDAHRERFTRWQRRRPVERICKRRRQ